MSAHHWTAQQRRGLALYRAGRDAEAAAALRGEEGSLVGGFRAAALWRAGQTQAALAALTEAVGAEPGWAGGWRLLGAALLAADQPAAAHLAWAEARRLEPATDLPGELAALPDPRPGLEADLAADPASLARRLTELGLAARPWLQAVEPSTEAGWRVVLGALGRLDPAAAFARLAALMTGEAPAPRRWAAAIAGDLARGAALGPQIEGLLVDLLDDDDPELRRAAQAAWLARWGTEEPARLEAALVGAPAGARAGLVAAVVAGAGDAEPLRRVYTHSQDAKVRRECLRGFELAGADDLVALVLWDETGALRAEAARLTVELALAAADEARFAEAANALDGRLVAEPDEYVAGELRTALARLPQPDTVEAPADEPAAEPVADEPAPWPGDDDAAL